MSTETILIEGWLEKISIRVTKSIHTILPSLWQKRYFVLYDTALKYWKKEKDFNSNMHPKGIINFNRILVNLDLQKDLKFDMHLMGCSRVFSLKGIDDATFENWVNKIDKVI